VSPNRRIDSRKLNGLHVAKYTVIGYSFRIRFLYENLNALKYELLPVVESGTYSINCSWWDIDTRTFCSWKQWRKQPWVSTLGHDMLSCSYVRTIFNTKIYYIFRVYSERFALHSTQRQCFNLSQITPTCRKRSLPTVEYQTPAFWPHRVSILIHTFHYLWSQN
jgi:hypothetical protein